MHFGRDCDHEEGRVKVTGRLLQTNFVGDRPHTTVVMPRNLIRASIQLLEKGLATGMDWPGQPGKDEFTLIRQNFRKAACPITPDRHVISPRVTQAYSPDRLKCGCKACPRTRQGSQRIGEQRVVEHRLVPSDSGADAHAHRHLCRLPARSMGSVCTEGAAPMTWSMIREMLAFLRRQAGWRR